MLPEWVSGTTLYHLHALRAVDGRGLLSLVAWLDHIASLGCRAVLLTPIHHSMTHGYDTVDPFVLDPRLGHDEDFDAFVAECGQRGLRVVLDGVFNHVGRDFPRRDWLSGRVWEGHGELPTLAHDNPEVVDWAIDVARRWLDRGASGWRIDVAYSMPRPFLRTLCDAVHASHPDAFLFGEMIHGDYAALAADTGLDAVTQYELFKALWSSFNDENLWELAWALERHSGFTAKAPMVTFAGNHDVTRIASNLRDPGHLEAVLSVLFTVAGVPSLYYGDELGWTGVKTSGAGGDDAIRPPLPPTVPAHPATTTFRRLIEFRRAHPELTEAPLEVVDRTNRTLTYRSGALTVRIDLDHGVTIDE